VSVGFPLFSGFWLIMGVLEDAVEDIELEVFVADGAGTDGAADCEAEECAAVGQVEGRAGGGGASREDEGDGADVAWRIRLDHVINVKLPGFSSSGRQRMSITRPHVFSSGSIAFSISYCAERSSNSINQEFQARELEHPLFVS
jgi:hypothetical protein